MLNVIDYIKEYAKAHNIKSYSLKSKVLTLNDLNGQKAFAPGIAFFYKLNICGEISDVANIGKGVLTVSTNTDFWDFSKMVLVQDYGTEQTATNDFIFECSDQAKFVLASGSNATFNTIYNASLYYLYLLPTADTEENSEANGANSKSIDFSLKY